MREVSLEVPVEAVEDVLDRLLPIVPRGVHEVERGKLVELRMRGDELPEVEEIARAAGRWRHRIEERTVPDDWRKRRLADYEPNPIGERLVVRPEWAPAAGPGMIEIVLEEGVAFGAGTHPTTRACLELLLELEPGGAFADLGCGSGVLAIAAAKLGWTPVLAVDVQPESAAAARANAGMNGVAVTATELDLLAEPPPAASGLAANVPPLIHARIAASLPDPLPTVAILSGFTPADRAELLDRYGARGFRVGRELTAHGWTVVRLERDLRTPPE